MWLAQGFSFCGFVLLGRNWDVRRFRRGLSNQAKKVKLPFEKCDKMYKKKKFCILKLLIVGPSCEEYPSDKGVGFLLIL